MKKILVVEDELGLRENIIALLEIRGFEIIPAIDGMDALKKLEFITPDLIISDIMMPYLDGYELFKRVKENDKTKFIPFLFLTAKSDLTSIRQGMSLGADDYVTKPFSSEDLLKAINTRIAKVESYDEKIEQVKNSIRSALPHELRTPLIGILGYSEIILSDQFDMSKDEIIEMVERISFSAKRLHNRIEKFLQIADLDLITKTNIINETIEAAISNDEVKLSCFNHLHIKERISDIELDLEPAFIKIHSRFLHLIVMEILENSVKYSHNGTQIFLKGEKKGSVYILSITDFGVGMKQDEIDNIEVFNQFERDFHQLDGNGLGLAFVKKAIKYFDGSFLIESQKNKFTRVTLTFLTTD
jgi:signal transduction histidine kinase